MKNNQIEFENHLNEAIRLAQIDKKNEAINLLNTAVQYEYTTGEAFLILGQLYDSIGNKEKAIDTYKRGINAHPKFVDNYFDLAVTYYEEITNVQNNIMNYPLGYLAETKERAKEYFLKAAYLEDNEAKNKLIEFGLKLTERNGIVAELEKLAYTRIEKHNFEEARPIYKFLFTMDNGKKEAVLNYAVCCMNIGQNLFQDMKYSHAYENYAKAYKYLTHLARIEPANTEYKELIGVLHYFTGNYYSAKNNHPKAIEHLEKARKLIGDRFDLLKSLGEEYFFSENIELGFDYLTQYANLNNLSFDTLREEVKILKYHKYLSKVNLLAGNKGHTNDEFICIKKAIQLLPNKQDAYSYLGDYYQDEGDNANALLAYKKGIEVEPNGSFTSMLKEEIKKLVQGANPI